MTKSKDLKNSFGLGLMEVIVFIAITSVLTLAVYKLIDFSLKINLDNKLKLTANLIASEKIEEIRNLPYVEIGTIGGVVNGEIPDVQQLQNQGSFEVRTFVQYKDDEFDGVSGGEPDDLVPTDYKYVKLSVSWQGPFGQEEIINYTTISPDGYEYDAGGGILKILVFDASGLPIEGANIHIENNLIDPVVNFDAESDSAGELVLLGVQASHESYEITVSKTGYSTSYTSPRTEENPNPTKPHASVIEGERTEVSFSIDLLSNLSIRAIRDDYENWMVNSDGTQRDQVNGVVGIDGNDMIYFVWHDIRGDGNDFLYMNKLDSSGVEVWPDQKVGNSNLQILPDIATDVNGTSYIVWQDAHYSHNEDIYIAAIDADGNNTWGGIEYRVNSDIGENLQLMPKIDLSSIGATTSIAWEDNRNGNYDIYIQTMDANAQKLWPNDVLVAGTSYDENSVDLVFDSNNDIVVSWVQEGASGDVYAQKIDLNGNNIWPSNLSLANTSLNEHNPALAADDNGNFYLAWTEEGEDMIKNVYLAKYNTNGTMLWKKNPNISSSEYNQYDPYVLFGNSFVYISWTDEREGNPDIYSQKLDPSGNKLWNSDFKVNDNINTSVQINSSMDINSTGEPLVCWQDDREGDYDINAAYLVNPNNFVYLSNVPFVITGTRKIYSEPDVYKYQEVFYTNISGEINLNDMEWDSYSIELLDSYTAYVISHSEPNRPISLPPDSSETVNVYLE